MDLWNIEVGRLKAKKVETRRELIIDPNDSGKYKGNKLIKRMPKSFVIKIKENKTGANVEFLDVRKKIILSKEEFI